MKVVDPKNYFSKDSKKNVNLFIHYLLKLILYFYIYKYN